MKVDDDVTVDLGRLEKILADKYGVAGPAPDMVECPSVMRNMRPWRQNHTASIMSKERSLISILATTEANLRLRH